MIGFAIAVAVVCAGVLAEFLFPGRPVFHAGWYNVLLLAGAIGIALAAGKLAGSAPARTIAYTLCALGAGIVALAGIANGLLAPDVATVIAAPGATVRVDDLGGSLVFAPDGGGVTLVRGSSRTIVPPSGQRLAGNFVLRSIPRSDVAVDATDRVGSHLTITQPSGTVFLSPVLTMQQRQTISGVALPYDTFAVPALHRIVHVVLFDPRQAAALLPSFDAGGRAVVLFAIDDEADRPLPRGIAVARDGAQVSVAGLRLRAIVTTYPAIEISTVPMPTIVLLGILIVLLGGAWPAIVARRLAAR
ncbi:MAG TPA: hypothetical protein VMS32_03580 [Verrucomicrobiae bacterium]|jgi:hypothetical protein|nr:hypothetical protein [Verrucomicrobiae bacterium]